MIKILVITEDIYEDAEEDYEGEYDEEVGAGDAPCILPTGNLYTYFYLYSSNSNLCRIK